MTQEQKTEKDYFEGITDADLQMLLAQNPLAAEQIRRIMAERQRAELEAKIAELKGSSNGTGDVVELVQVDAD